MKFITGTLLFSLLFSAFTFAQQEVLTSCDNKKMHEDLVWMDGTLEKQGFTVQQFRMLNIPVKTYVPVEVEMKAGKVYQVNFLAAPGFQKCTLTLIGKDKKELIKKKYKGDGNKGIGNNENQFSQSFAPPYTGTYWIIISQKVKGNDMACAGLSILESQ
jgi:hypothetical protein